MTLPGKTLKNHHAECVIFVFQALKKPGFLMFLLIKKR